jgi:hypothetical protein
VPPDDAAVLRGIAVTGAPAYPALRPIRVVRVDAADLTDTDVLRLARNEPFVVMYLAGLMAG